MEVSFTTTADDVANYLAHVFWKNRNARTYYLALWLMIPLGCFVATGLMLSRGEPNLATILTPILGVMYFIAAPLYFCRRFRRSARASAQALPPGLLGPTTLVVTDTTLSHITAASRVEVPWSDVEKVEVLGDMLTISLGGVLPFLVPQRGFADPAAFLAVRDLVMTQVRQER